MAYDFKADGLCYNVNQGDTTVSVTHQWEGKDVDADAALDYVTGNVVIPSQVTHDGKTYTVTAIDEAAFYDCKELTGVSLPPVLTAIGDFAFCMCDKLEAVEFPESLTSIGNYAYYGCTVLTDVVIPSTITQVGYGAFAYCYGLNSVDIGASIEQLWFVFWECNRLQSVTCRALIPPYMGMGANAETHEKAYNFTDLVNQQAILYVPRESLDAYRRANQWRNFRRILPIGAILCDVNEDGEVNIADVNAIVNCVLSQDTDMLADVNGDGEISLADVNAVIDAVLNQQ